MGVGEGGSGDADELQYCRHGLQLSAGRHYRGNTAVSFGKSVTWRAVGGTLAAKMSRIYLTHFVALKTGGLYDTLREQL